MNHHEPEDESGLVRNLSKGNLMAFNTFYRMYSLRLYRFAYGYLKTEAEAEELVQEVFKIIWEKRKELKEEFSFKSYLFTIAYNLVKKHFRTRSYMNAYVLSGTVNDVDTDTQQKIAHDSLYQYIMRLVSKLPEKRRKIFILSRIEGKSIKEISEELNISHKTVENQLTDALRFIRTSLNREEIK